jgi:hypothetical protein
MPLATSMTVVLADMAPWLGVIIPPLAALVMRANARANVKLTVPLVLTVVVAVVSLATTDWAELSVRIVGERLLVLAGESQFTYVAVKLALQQFTDHSSINTVPLFSPSKGIR